MSCLEISKNLWLRLKSYLIAKQLSQKARVIAQIQFYTHLI